MHKREREIVQRLLSGVTDADYRHCVGTVGVRAYQYDGFVIRNGRIIEHGAYGDADGVLGSGSVSRDRTDELLAEYQRWQADAPARAEAARQAVEMAAEFDRKYGDLARDLNCGRGFYGGCLLENHDGTLTWDVYVLGNDVPEEVRVAAYRHGYRVEVYGRRYRLTKLKPKVCRSR